MMQSIVDIFNSSGVTRECDGRTDRRAFPQCCA